MPTVPSQSSVVSYGYLSQPQSATPHTGGMNALLCDGSVRLLNDSVADYNPYVTVDYTETTRSTESHDDGGIIIDFFPTETIRPIESLGDGGIIIDYTPGPDDNVGLPAVQKTDNGLLLPAVRVDGGEAGIKDGTSNTVTFTYTVSVEPADYSGSHALYQDVFVPTPSASNPHHGDDSFGLWQISL